VCVCVCVRYAISEWGWNDGEKQAEMSDAHAWYLLAHDQDRDGRPPVAAVHFRFDIDNDDEVLYWCVAMSSVLGQCMFVTATTVNS